MTEDRNKQYCNTVKDLLLPNTINQKDEKPHTAGLNDTAIPHFKIQITEIPLEKKLNTVSPHFPLHAVEEVIENLGLKHPIISWSILS